MMQEIYIIQVVDEMIDSRCELLSSSCTFKAPCNCSGSIETNGHHFHEECPIATCCQDKGFEYCGLCSDLPYEQLYSYSYLDKEDGDNPPGVRE